MATAEVANKIVGIVFREFDGKNKGHLSKTQFVDSINFLSRNVGGIVCCRPDLDSLFQIIDINGDQVICRK
jgi:Ca2+-binding EF-hand superfamily protein